MLLNVKVFVYLFALLSVGIYLVHNALLPQYRRVVGPKKWILVLLIPFVGLFGGSIYVLDAFLFCIVAFTSSNRRELCGTYVLALPMLPVLATQLTVAGVFLLPLHTFSALNAGALVGMMLTRRGPGRIEPTLATLFVLLLIVMVYIQIRGSSPTGALRVIVDNALFVVPPFLLASSSGKSAEDVRSVLLNLVYATVAGSVVALFGAVRRWDLYEAFYRPLGVQPVFGTTLTLRGGLLRMGGPVGDYSAFGVLLAAVLVPLPALRGLFRRDRFVMVAGALLVGIATTQSRGAWAGMVVGYAASLAFRGRVGAAVGATAAIGIGYSLLTLAAGSNSELGETLGITGHSAGTAEYRRLLFEQGMEQIWAHPLAGQTPAQLTANLPDLVQGQHIVDFVNSHLYVAMASGLIGFAIWVAVWTTAVVKLVQHTPREPANARLTSVAASLAAAIVAVSVALVFTSLSDRNLIWPVLCLGFAVPVLMEARRRAPGSATMAQRTVRPAGSALPS